MTEYEIKRRDLFSIGPHILGFLFIAVGAFTIVSLLFMVGNSSVWKAIIVGTLVLLLGLIVMTSYGGTLFDFKRKIYKNYYSLLGLNIGQWQNLPNVKIIRVFPSTFIDTRSSENATIYKIALYTESPKPVLVFENYSMDKTLKEAKILAKNLKVVLDIRKWCF